MMTMTFPDPTRRKLDMDAFDDDDDEQEEEMERAPTVLDLFQQLDQLQEAVRQLGPVDSTLFDNENFLVDGFTSTDRRGSFHRNFPAETRWQLGRRVSASDMYEDIKGSSLTSTPTRAVDLATPPKRRPTTATSRTMPRPTRVAALTRENISLLPTPAHRHPNAAGSVCGSQQSRTSVRTDGGAVFSRLYQSDYHKNRDSKLRAMRERQEAFNLSFIPRTNHRSSISSQNSVGSSSITSAKTDIVNVSSRLYDPDYIKKRNARLHRLREEREMRDCTFTPTINHHPPVTRRSTLTPHDLSRSLGPQ